MSRKMTRSQQKAMFAKINRQPAKMSKYKYNTRTTQCAKIPTVKAQKHILPENRTMIQTTKIRDIRNKKTIIVGTDGTEYYEKQVKPVKIGKDHYDLQHAWYVIPASWRRVDAINKLKK